MWTAPRRGVFLEPFAFTSPSVGRVEIEAGFDTDYASVPRAFWWLFPPDGAYSPAAWVHDCLYWHHAICEGGLPIKREQADTVFLEGMEALGINWITRRVMFRAVRNHGQAAWDENLMNRLGLPLPEAAASPSHIKQHFHKLRR